MSHIITIVPVKILVHSSHSVNSVYIDSFVRKDVTPLLTLWSYAFLALTYRYLEILRNKETEWLHEFVVCKTKQKITSHYYCIIVSDNGLSPSRRQANAGILLIGPLRINFSEILIEIETFLFRKMHLRMSSILSRCQCVKYHIMRDLLKLITLITSARPSQSVVGWTGGVWVRSAFWRWKFQHARGALITGFLLFSPHIDGLVRNCSSSSALASELLQSGTRR